MLAGYSDTKQQFNGHILKDIKKIFASQKLFYGLCAGKSLGHPGIAGVAGYGSQARQERLGGKLAGPLCPDLVTPFCGYRSLVFVVGDLWVTI
jgi:hypothetical protein